MTNFEQTLLREISTLPEARRADVLAFVRFLKISLPDEEQELEKRCYYSGPFRLCLK